MVDLETLSVRPNAVILVIGAIKFNRGETWNENIEQKDIDKLDFFYTRINITTCIQAGMHIDPATEKWWEQQDDDVNYEALKNTDRVSLVNALKSFKKWFGNSYNKKIWGNGSSFDCTILGEAYKKSNMEVPWKFFNERDLRTIMDLGKVNSFDLPQYQKHHALWDCYRQIIGFQKAEKNLGLV
jgi:hypothetical protein